MADAALKLAMVRAKALHSFYTGERLSGVDEATAHQRMQEHGKRLDQLEYEVDLEVIRIVMERTS